MRKEQIGQSLYIHFNGRTIKAEEAIEMWRKQGIPEQGAHLQSLGNLTNLFNALAT